VSNELGAGNPKSAFFSVWVVTVLCGTITVILAIVILCLRNYISYLFTEGETVSNAVADLCPLLTITLILNGIQPVLSGNFRKFLHMHMRYLDSWVLHQYDLFILKHLGNFVPHLHFIFIQIIVLGRLVFMSETSNISFRFSNQTVFWLKVTKFVNS
jgi:hypothetical protein